MLERIRQPADKPILKSRFVLEQIVEEVEERFNGSLTRIDGVPVPGIYLIVDDRLVTREIAYIEILTPMLPFSPLFGGVLFGKSLAVSLSLLVDEVGELIK